MRAQALELLSSLGTDGELGDCKKDGRHLTVPRTSGGQRQLVSSSLLSTLCRWEDQNDISEYMETIKESSRAGGMGVAGTWQSILSSEDSYPLLTIPQDLILFTPHTFKANAIQQMIHPEESTVTQNSCFRPFPSQQHFNRSSWTHSSSQQTQRNMRQAEPVRTSAIELLSAIQIVIPMHKRAIPQIHSITSTNSNSRPVNKTRFQAILPVEKLAIPQPYRQGLIPSLSQLRPHCLAWD